MFQMEQKWDFELRNQRKYLSEIFETIQTWGAKTFIRTFFCRTGEKITSFFGCQCQKIFLGQSIKEKVVIFLAKGMNISELMNVTTYKTKPRSQREPEW